VIDLESPECEGGGGVERGGTTGHMFMGRIEDTHSASSGTLSSKTVSGDSGPTVEI
jgi:hypothetical protein